MSRSAKFRAALAALALGLLLALLTVLDVYGDKIMKRLLRLAAVVGAGLLATACTSFDAIKFTEAANKLDPDCGKLVDVRVGTNWIFGWPVPVVTGSYTKVCEPEKLKAAPARPALVLGQPVG